MRKTNETVYRCDHCNKAMVSAGFMKLHEKMCKKNPNNQHQCFKYCANLIKDQAETRDEDGNVFLGQTCFSCKKKPNVELYSYKLERYKSNKKRIEQMERMPLACELYECEDGHDFGEIDDKDLYDLNCHKF